MNNNRSAEEHYLQSSSGSGTSSTSILLADSTEEESSPYQNNIHQEQSEDLIFNMENVSDLTVSVTSFPDEDIYSTNNNSNEQHPASPPYSPKDTSVTMRSSIQNDAVEEENLLMYSRSLGAFEMDSSGSFITAYDDSSTLFGTSLPTSILAIWNLYKDKPPLTESNLEEVSQTEVSSNKEVLQEDKEKVIVPEDIQCLSKSASVQEDIIDNEEIPTCNNEPSVEEDVLTNRSQLSTKVVENKEPYDKEPINTEVSTKEEEPTEVENPAKEKELSKEEEEVQEIEEEKEPPIIDKQTPTMIEEEQSVIEDDASTAETPSVGEDTESSHITDESIEASTESYTLSPSTPSVLENDMSEPENLTSVNTIQSSSPPPQPPDDALTNASDKRESLLKAEPYVPSSREFSNASRHYYTKRPHKRVINKRPNRQLPYKLYKKAAVLKVVGLNYNTVFRDLQSHFYDTNILSIRYLRPLHTAFITFRNHLSMEASIYRLDGTYLDGAMISCIPSNAKTRASEARSPEKFKLQNYSNQGIRDYANLRNDPTVPYVLHYTVLQTQTYFERFFIIKPKFVREVDFSMKHNYWYANPRICEYISRLFKNTQSVYFIFSITGSKALQGYARMKSGVIDIKSARPSELEGTPFSPDRDITFGNNGKIWQYVCRVEWLMRGHVPLESFASLKNAWGNNSTVKTSTDFTQLDPEVGRFIMQKFHT